MEADIHVTKFLVTRRLTDNCLLVLARSASEKYSDWASGFWDVFDKRRRMSTLRRHSLLDLGF